MDCQGAREEPKGGQEDQGTFQQLGGVPLSSFTSFPVLLAFLLALPGLLGNPSSYPYLEACTGTKTMNLNLNCIMGSARQSLIWAAGARPSPIETVFFLS